MKRHILFLSLLLAVTGTFSFTGCNRSGAVKEPPITGQPSDPPADLKPKWAPGQRYLMSLEMNQSTEVNARTNTVTQQTDLTQEYALTVTNAADGNRGVEIEILTLVVDVTAGDRAIVDYDSLNKAVLVEGPEPEALQRLIGGKVNFLLSPENKVLAVTGVNELIKRMDADVGSTNNARGGRVVRGTVGGVAAGRGGVLVSGVARQIFTPDYFKQLVELSVFPMQAVRVGESWPGQREITAGMVGTLVVTTTNTFKGWQEHDGKKCARIEFTGTLASKARSVTGGLAGFVGGSLRMGNGTTAGRSWFNAEAGLPVETQIDQSYTMTSTLPNFSRSARGRGVTNAPARGSVTNSIPMKQTIKVKLVETRTVGAQP